jgi:hypothetical protein
MCSYLKLDNILSKSFLLFEGSVMKVHMSALLLARLERKVDKENQSADWGSIISKTVTLEPDTTCTFGRVLA